MYFTWQSKYCFYCLKILKRTINSVWGFFHWEGEGDHIVPSKRTLSLLGVWINKNEGRNWISLAEKAFHRIRQEKMGSLLWSELHISKNKREKTSSSHYFKERSSPLWVLLCGLIDRENWKSRHLGSVPIIWMLSCCSFWLDQNILHVQGLKSTALQPPLENKQFK